MNLLVDLGNSRLKWGVDNGAHIIPGAPIRLDRGMFVENIVNAWKGLEAPRQVAVSSVSSEALNSKIREAAVRLWPSTEIVIAQTSKMALGVQNAYKNPKQLGVDRWLCMLALRRYYSIPACVVDCGTAITLDLLNGKGIHLGGLIMPGLTLMKKSLYQGTQQLQFTEEKFPVGLSDSTEAGIYNGTLFSVVGMVEHVLKKQKGKFNLILTGGDAEIIAENISIEFTIEPDLVLQGLSVYLDPDS